MVKKRKKEKKSYELTLMFNSKVVLSRILGHK